MYKVLSPLQQVVQVAQLEEWQLAEWQLVDLWAQQLVDLLILLHLQLIWHLAEWPQVV
jgi:hypothetical protein